MVLRIFKMITTSGFLAALECTNSFATGAPPRTPLGELTAHPRPLAGLRDPTFKGEEGRKRGMGERKGRNWVSHPGCVAQSLEGRGGGVR